MRLSASYARPMPHSAFPGRRAARSCPQLAPRVPRSAIEPVRGPAVPHHLLMSRSLAGAPSLAALFPDGVASRARLLALGISSRTIDRRCRRGGPWQRLCLGVVLLHNGLPTPRQRARAGLLHAGDDAMLTGSTGAGLHGVDSLPCDPRVHVLVEAGCHVASREFVLVTRTYFPPQPDDVAGLPVAPAVRCVVDAGAMCRSIDQTRAMVADAVQRGICRIDDLIIESRRARPGIANVRLVLSEIGDGVRSAAEAWAREVVQRSDLPDPMWNVALYAMDGRRIGVVDAYWPAVGLAWEIQSQAFHLTPSELRRDVEKQNDLVANGVIVAQTMASRLRTDPRGVVADLTRAHSLGASTPPPAVVAQLWRPTARR